MSNKTNGISLIGYHGALNEPQFNAVLDRIASGFDKAGVLGYATARALIHDSVRVALPTIKGMGAGVPMFAPPGWVFIPEGGTNQMRDAIQSVFDTTEHPSPSAVLDAAIGARPSTPTYVFHHSQLNRVVKIALDKSDDVLQTVCQSDALPSSVTAQLDGVRDFIHTAKTFVDVSQTLNDPSELAQAKATIHELRAALQECIAMNQRGVWPSEVTEFITDTLKTNPEL